MFLTISTLKMTKELLEYIDYILDDMKTNQDY